MHPLRQSTIFAGEQQKNTHMSCSFQKETFVCVQKETFLKGRAMEENDGFGLLVWWVLEEEDIAVVAEAADYF